MYIKCNLVWLFKRLNVNIPNMQYFILTYYQFYNIFNEILVIMFKKRLYCVETMMDVCTNYGNYICNRN